MLGEGHSAYISLEQYPPRASPCRTVELDNTVGQRKQPLSAVAAIDGKVISDVNTEDPNAAALLGAFSLSEE